MAMPHSLVHLTMGYDWHCTVEGCTVRDQVFNSQEIDMGLKDHYWPGEEEGYRENRNSNRGRGEGYSENRQGYGENKQGSKELCVYRDGNDWWVGLYRGPNHYYLCLLPTIVIRWKRFRVDEIGDAPNDAH